MRKGKGKGKGPGPGARARSIARGKWGRTVDTGHPGVGLGGLLCRPAGEPCANLSAHFTICPYPSCLGQGRGLFSGPHYYHVIISLFPAFH